MFEIRPGHHRAGDIGLFGPSRQANPWFGVGAFLPESSSRRRPGSRRCVRRQGRDPGLRRDDEEGERSAAIQYDHDPALPALGGDRHTDYERVMNDPLATHLSHYANPVPASTMAP